jgi:hypothetical protein
MNVLGCFVHRRYGYGFSRDRCSRLSCCTRPEKSTCPAVEAEKAYLERQAQIDRNIQELKLRIQEAH